MILKQCYYLLYNQVTFSPSPELSSVVELSLSLLETISTSFLVVLADLAGICLLTAVDGIIACIANSTDVNHV